MKSRDLDGLPLISFSRVTKGVTMVTPKSTPLYRSLLGNPPEPPVNTAGAQNSLELQEKDISKLIRKNISPIDRPTRGNKPIRKPINGYDRLNALIRIPEVKRDLEAIEKESNERKKVELQCRFYEKYNVDVRLLQRPEVFHKFKDFLNSGAIQVFSNFDKSNPDFISKYRDGKHIIVAVDMSKKRQDITREFSKMLARINKDYKISKDKSRNRNNELDHWEIYNLYKREGLKFVEIARKNRPDRAQKSGSDSLSLKNECMTVSRAYNKAKTIIEQMQKDLGLNTKKEKKDYHKNHS